MTAELYSVLGVDPHDSGAILATELVKADGALLDALVLRRKKLNLTQQEVGARMGVSQGAVARIEAGDRDPHLSTLRRYALALEVLVTHSVTPFSHKSGPLPEWPHPAAQRASEDWAVVHG